MPRAVVTGGAGFVGSHLCERLVREGFDVFCFDSLLTGSEENLTELLRDPAFTFERYDVTNYLHVEGPVDFVLHFASPASPKDYHAYPLETLKVGAYGAHRALGLARTKGAVALLASTSEVYGDPLEHPQRESYWGNVNPVGPRSVYDEAKRYAEALGMGYHRELGLPVKLARIFNTYGPRMRRGDGRAVPNFVDQALGGRPLTVEGEGLQTRSLCYVDDLIEGVVRLLLSDHVGPMNVGNPEEVTILELAELIRDLTESGSGIEHLPAATDDPRQRCPDISLAAEVLGWKPSIALREGLERTISWAKEAWYANRTT